MARAAFRGPRLDAGLAGALVVLGQVEVWLVSPPDEGRAGVAAATLVMTAAVAWRRSRPLGAVAVFAAAYVASLPLVGSPAPWVLAQGLGLFGLAFTLAAQLDAGTALAGALLLVAAFWTDALRAGAPASDYVAPLVGVSVCWTAGRLLHRERAQARALAEAHARLGGAQERARIARELHDIVGHSLTVIALQADAAQAAFATQPERSHRALGAIDRTARQALQDVRRVVAALREEGEDGARASLAGLAPLVEEVRAAGTPVELRVDGPLDLPPTVDASAYRIVQEALTNVRRHAPGARVDVRLSRHDGALEVRIANGAAAEAAAPATGSGYGLVGARERVRALGGTLSAGPDGEGGWRLEARLPL